MSMSRPPKALEDNSGVERVTPRSAIAMLIHGLLSPEDQTTFKPADLTVETIVKMLRRANEVRNRMVSPATVSKYARDMANGQWLWTGAPIQIDWDGYIRNGQHRLLAVIESNTTQDFMVIRNLDPKAQIAIDIGRTRRIADQMHMFGVSNANQVTSVATLLWKWRQDRIMLASFKPSIYEIKDLIDTEDEIGTACQWGIRLRQRIGHAPISALGAVFVEAGHINRDERDKFFADLLSGADLSATDPVHVLRNNIIRNQSTTVRYRHVGQLCQVVLAWNLRRKGKIAHQIRVPNMLTSATFPKVV